ncbi:interferon-induced protein 44-like [Lampris incognitus]|uniref:interferon-induced protein 44-like n=1 Tax=Lampris incognitus TaxID=2546036 RepID=UPI0024B52CA1|nr:interferon-induced protein 44-like [Lampris incognitus]XP_056144489.1 interferon-induced protein 44-like [Lampris incognitus]
MEEQMQFLQFVEPGSDAVSNIRIMLYGPVGAGKSSFINSVNSILQGRMAGEALADSVASSVSFTKKYTTYKMKKGRRGQFYPFVFNDIMGLEGQVGVCMEDIKLALTGHMREGYKFNPASPLSKDDAGFNPCPTPDDIVHVLVCVVPSPNTSQIPGDTMKQMRDIRLFASDRGIPQIAVITKIDEACPEVERDIRNVYKSKLLKKNMEDFSARLGIPMNCIFPVKNYHEETSLDDDVSLLILTALKQITDFGKDYIEHM